MELPDLQEIHGNHRIKRGLEIAAAGGHHVFLYGAPESLKSLLARALAGLLPDPGEEERQELERIYRLAGLPEPEGAPVRAPNRYIRPEGLVGTCRPLRPGGASLSHAGTLILDPVEVFDRVALRALDPVLRDREVRFGGGEILPARALLVCVMTACPCGEPAAGKCTCTYEEVERYWVRHIFRVIGFMDLSIPVLRFPISEALSRAQESSVEARERVEQAREIIGAPCSPSVLQGRVRTELLDDTGRALVGTVSCYFRHDASRLKRAMTVARTIAALDGREKIGSSDLAEAASWQKMSGEDLADDGR